jgi:hypothetical protein
MAALMEMVKGNNNNNNNNKYTLIKCLSKDWSKRYPSKVIIEQPHLQASLENVNILTLLQLLWKTIPQQWRARSKTLVTKTCPSPLHRVLDKSRGPRLSLVLVFKLLILPCRALGLLSLPSCCNNSHLSLRQQFRYVAQTLSWTM